MQDRATTVNHNVLVALPRRSLGEKVAQQFFVILPDRLCQHAFHVMTDGDGQARGSAD